MVEIAHGFGLKTRYAHLLSVNVVMGQVVAKGASVGKLRSTGRSTGPHVHYEVWYDDKVRNPDGFLRAGQLKNARYSHVLATLVDAPSAGFRTCYRRCACVRELGVRAQSCHAGQ